MLYIILVIGSKYSKPIYAREKAMRKNLVDMVDMYIWK